MSLESPLSSGEEEEFGSSHGEEEENQEAEKENLIRNENGDIKVVMSEKEAVVGIVCEDGADVTEPTTSSQSSLTEPTRHVLESPALPMVSLKHGLNRKASPLSLQPWVAMSLTLDGRDKITKLLQYSARTLAWWCQSSSFSAGHAQRFKALQASLTTSRKAYRLGRSVIEIEKLRAMGLLSLVSAYWRKKLKGCKEDDENATYSPKSPTWKVLGTALKMLGLLGFWACDNVSFLTSSGVLDNFTADESQRLSQRQSLSSRASKFANRSYFVGALAGLYVSLRSYLEFRQNEIRFAQDELERMRSDDTNKETCVEEAQRALEQAREKQFSLFLALLKVSASPACDTILYCSLC